MLIGISLTIFFHNKTKEEAFPSTMNSNNIVNLIVIYNLFTNNYEKIFYGYSKITNMILLGGGDNLIVACNLERSIDIFDMKNTDEKYCQIFENKINPTYSAFENKEINQNLKFKLKLPTTTSGQIFSSNILSIHKKFIESTANSKIKCYKLYMMDIEGIFIVFEINESSTNSEVIKLATLDNFPLKKVKEINLHTQLSRLFIHGENDSEFGFGINKVKCKEFNLSKKYSNSFTDIVYISTNFGLVKVTLAGKDEISLNVIHFNKDDFSKVASFDVSDTGHLLICYSDFTVKILDENSFAKIFQASVSTLTHDTYIDKILFANIICKNDKSKLIRKSLIANFYIITSKNEFIIFDLNQKNKSDIKKIKKKIELGQKKGLTKRNSLLAISDSLLIDYSNYILQSNNKDRRVEFFKLSLRKQFYELTNIKSNNEKILEKISKL